MTGLFSETFPPLGFNVNLERNAFIYVHVDILDGTREPPFLDHWLVKCDILSDRHTQTGGGRWHLMADLCDSSSADLM